MNEYIFGWITKPHLQMSFLDHAAQFVEFALVVVVVCGIWAIIEVRGKK